MSSQVNFIYPKITNYAFVLESVQHATTIYIAGKNPALKTNALLVVTCCFRYQWHDDVGSRKSCFSNRVCLTTAQQFLILWNRILQLWKVICDSHFVFHPKRLLCKQKNSTKHYLVLNGKWCREKRIVILYFSLDPPPITCYENAFKPRAVGRMQIYHKHLNSLVLSGQKVLDNVTDFSLILFFFGLEDRITGKRQRTHTAMNMIDWEQNYSSWQHNKVTVHIIYHLRKVDLVLSYLHPFHVWTYIIETYLTTVLLFVLISLVNDYRTPVIQVQVLLGASEWSWFWPTRPPHLHPLPRTNLQSRFFKLKGQYNMPPSLRLSPLFELILSHRPV